MANSQDPSIVIVGPTHPYTGGIAQHTTRLAQELDARGIPVLVESWQAQYPKRLYPGPDRVPGGEPEVGRAPRVTEKLAWYNPLSWWSAGWRHRKVRTLVLTVPTPFHAVPYLVVLLAVGRTPQRIAMVHNVLPHEPGPLDRLLMRVLLTSVDRVIVHGQRARDTAIELGVSAVSIDVQSLPSPWPQKAASTSRTARTGPVRCVFFGTIRHYKGLDLLLRALSRVDTMEVLVAGEFWDEREPYDALVRKLGLGKRVTIRAGYVAEADFADVFSAVDLAVLPYRSGTGSIVRELAFSHGLPVIATDVGAIAEGIIPGTNGDVVAAGDEEALVEALTRANNRRIVRSWQQNVAAQPGRNAEQWESYCHAVSGMTATGGE